MYNDKKTRLQEWRMEIMNDLYNEKYVLRESIQRQYNINFCTATINNEISNDLISTWVSALVIAHICYASWRTTL